MIAYFNRFDIKMTKDEARSASHQGKCDDDVKQLLVSKKIKNQLSKISDDDLISELKEYGAWDDEELKNRSDNEERIVWIAAGNIIDDLNNRK